MKNNKGFTLVELLVAISILAILTIIAIPTLRAFQTNNDKKTYDNYGKSIVTSAKLYNDSYKEDLFGNLDNGCQKITLTEMMNKKVAKDIALKDVTCNKPEKDSYVLVWKYNNEYAFDSVVHCENSKGVNQYEDKNEALAEACVTATGKPYITVNTVSNEANNTKKKSVIINLNDEFGFSSNQEIQYAFSTINNANGSGVTGYKTYKFNNSYIKRKNTTVKLSTNSITIPSETTGTYYLYVKPIKVQNIINESITNIHKFGPYRFDHEPPGCPTITAYKSDGGKVNKNTPGQISKFTIKYSADDLQNYEFKISYDNGSSWSSATTYGKDKKEYTPTQDGKIIIKTRGRDYANNFHSSWCTSDMYIRDTTPPSVPTVKGYKKNDGTDISSKGSLAEHATNTWLKGWVFIQASGSTDVNGGVTYHYSAEGATTNTTDTKASYRNVDAEGTSTVKFWVCDSINNCSSKVSYVAKLDRTAPTGMTLNGYLKTSKNDVTSSSGLSTYTANTWSNKWVLVTASGAKDALGNGVNYYRGSTKTSVANVNAQGTTTVKMKVCDNLSNCTGESSFVVKLDRCEATSTSWGNYGDCSKKCGGGTKTRKGTKYSTVTGHTDYKCSSDNSETSSTSCNTQDCCSSTSNADCGAWTWSSCTKSCGSGTKYQYRTCKKKSNYDGSICSGTVTEKRNENTSCNTQGCCSSTVNYACGDWSWTSCTKSCGGGTKYQYRSCKKKSAYDGSACSGTATETRNGGTSCNTQSCCSESNPGGCETTTPCRTAGVTVIRPLSSTTYSGYSGYICNAYTLGSYWGDPYGPACNHATTLYLVDGWNKNSALTKVCFYYHYGGQNLKEYAEGASAGNFVCYKIDTNCTRKYWDGADCSDTCSG